MTDWDVPAISQAWIREQRERAIAYLSVERVSHRAPPKRPRWHVAPYVAVWRLPDAKSRAHPIWVITGDLPTDYLQHAGVKNARTAIKAFGARWSRVAKAMSGERTSSRSSIRNPHSPSERRALAALLQSRARMLLEWSRDASIWAE